MYKTVVDNTPLIKVSSAKHEANYSVNGSLMNPLEAFYAALAACAAVYAKKACKELGIPAEGIEIACKPFAGPGGPLTLAKFKSDVHFPEHFTTEQKAKILDSIAHCAVKEIVMDGPSIEFQVAEV
ncbi:OsmC family protein [Ferribacterium limneticum]|uniref:OsmC family protein n=1 Tax=Ferribacterium limneticum TaxID=76259 RepID=UPI001CF97315|nr:OsmC family protein [Ferribacterium limneticum]UCV27991.1 OsmC family protein [Ferribacterium limneticum]UCV31908.1 OsmC family protein [Ferribacterium limneticum]